MTMQFCATCKTHGKCANGFPVCITEWVEDKAKDVHDLSAQLSRLSWELAEVRGRVKRWDETLRADLLRAIDSTMPAMLADRGPCTDCGATMRACWEDPTSVCCGTCIHHAASTTGTHQENPR